MYRNSLDPEQFTAASVDSYKYTDPVEHDRAVRDSLDVIELLSDANQAFSGLHLNRQAMGEAPILRVNSWHSASTTRQQKYTTYQYAAANPDRQILAIDFPSHGRSDKMSRQQYRNMFSQRSLAAVAVAQTEAIMNFLPSLEEAIILGDSIGGQITPDMARNLGKHGIKPILLMGFDMTGVNDFSSSKAGKKQIRSNKFKGHQAYHAGPDNRKLDDAYQAFSKELDMYGYDDTEYSPANLVKRDPLMFAMMMTISPAKTRHGMDALIAAMGENQGMQSAMVSGGRSRMCAWEKVAPDVTRLQAQYGERFAWDLWPNDSHSMGIAEQQPRFASFTKAQIQKLMVQAQITH